MPTLPSSTTRTKVYKYKISFVFSPTGYSPELIPVEHLWSDLRAKYFSNRILKSMAKVVDTLCSGLFDLSSDPERLRSMTYFPHMRINF